MKGNLIGLFRYVKNILPKHKTLPKETECKFTSLSPSLILDKKDQFYLDILDDALKNKNNKNIAITGIYGSGKSTIIRSYEFKHSSKYSFLNISLASFNDSKLEKLTKQAKNKSSIRHDNVLEASILQQMFYHVKSDDIPDSRFKRIRHQSQISLSLKAILFVIWMLSIFLVINFKMWKIFPYLVKDIFSLNTASCVIVLGIFLYGVMHFTKLFLRLINNAKFNKLNLKTIEIEINNKKDSSVLNKHLDEILYFFEVNDFNVIVFEDLDRFKNYDIFTKLRELNTLINNSQQVGKDIKFIYAIKDDMFVDEERTKFFDFIIPVIPVITAANSEEKLIHELEKHRLTNLLPREFLSDISFYISDMRMLINIVNEFAVYHQKLGKLNLDAQNIFAMVVYKNQYPEDFAKLHKNSGMIYQTINQKNSLLKQLTTYQRDDINSIKESIDQVDKSFVDNISELRSIYIFQIMKQLPETSQINLQIERKYLHLKQLLQDELFEEFKNSQNVIISSQSHSNSRKHISFNELENTVNSNQTYDEREEILSYKKEIELNNFKDKLSKLEKEIKKINHYRFIDIIEKLGENDIFKAKISKAPLLKFLIRNGYINEEYEDYISYFYEGSITKGDKDFLLSIKNRQALNFDYKLEKEAGVITKIWNREYEQVEILNYDLLDYMLEMDNKYKSKLDIVFKQISNGSEKSIAFIHGYLSDDRKFTKSFFCKICKNWKTMWKHLLEESQYSPEQINNFLKLTISYANINDVISQNENNLLKNYIDNSKNFLSVVKDISDKSRIFGAIKELCIEFESLQFVEGAKDILEFIYENQYYSINEKNIELILNTFDAKSLVNYEILSNANYTVISMSNCEDLKKHIADNINLYTENVLLKLSTNTGEAIDSIILLLNNEGISLNNKMSFIKKQNNVLEDINYVGKDLWGTLISTRKVAINWNNLLSYYVYINKGNEEPSSNFNEILLDVFNDLDLCKELSKFKLYNSKGFKTLTIVYFLHRLAESNSIPLNCYKEIIKSIYFSLPYINAKDLDHEKIKILINKKKLSMSACNYEELKEYCQDEHINLLIVWFKENIKHFNDFIKKYDDYNFDLDDLYMILASNDITLYKKLKFIKIAIKDSNDLDHMPKLLDKIAETIIQKGLNNEYLFKRYYELIEKIIYFGNSPVNKVKLLQKIILELERYQIYDFLNYIGEPYSLLSKNKRPKFKDNQLNQTFLSSMKELDLIYSFKPMVRKGFLRAHPKIT